MLKSMTAYGRATCHSKEGRFVAEIQSLNRKFLEILIQLPKELSGFETEVRKWVSSRVPRGKVSIKIAVTYEEKIPFSVLPNLPLVKQLKTAWERIAAELDDDANRTISLEMLANQEDILLYSNEFDEEDYKNSLREAVDAAIDDFVAMKIREGNELKEDFVQRIQNLNAFLEQVNGLTGSSVNRLQEKLKKKLEEFFPGKVENEERLLREICLYADKIDITEEMVRLSSHLGQFTSILESAASEKGKTLEFILQEMHREVNTIGSKSDDVKVTKLVIDMKGEIEKIREQIQNVE